MSRLNARMVYLVMSGAWPFLMSTIWIAGAVYYVVAVHMNPLQLVLVGTGLEVGYFAFQIPTGLFADMVSRRTSVVIGWCIGGCCWIVEGLVPVFGAVLIAETVRGAGMAFIDGAESAWLADEVGESSVGPLMVRGSQIAQIAGMAGTITGVSLGTIRLNLPVVLGGVLLLAMGVVLALVMPEQGFRPARREEQSRLGAVGATLRAGIRGVRASTVLLLLVAVSLVSGAASEGFDRLWQAHLIHDVQFPQMIHLKVVAWFGVIGLANGLICTLALTICRARLQRISQSQGASARVLLGLNGVCIVAIAVFGLAHAFVVAFIALAIKAVTGTFMGPLYESWLIQNIDPRVRATVLSISSQANAVGQIAMGPVVGAIGAVLSLRAAIIAAGILLSPVLPLYARTLRGETLVTAEEAPEVVTSAAG